MMKRTILIHALIVGLAFISQGQNQTTVEVSYGSMKWEGCAAVGAYCLDGTLDISAAELTVSSDEIENANFSVDMSSLTSETKDLESHLKTRDFFHIKKFPEASFNLDSHVKLQEGEQQVTGEMTIKGITKTVDFILQLFKEDATWRLKGEIFMNRVDFGITYNSPSVYEKLKDQAIADEIKLEVEIQVTIK